MRSSFSKIIVVAFLIGGIACVSKKPVVDETVVEDNSSKLIFLNYFMVKDENDIKSITFINKLITDGRLKSSSNKYVKTGKLGDLKCIQLNKDSVEIASVILKNPLFKTIEFVNDSLNFENKSFELRKAYFSIRLQLHSQTAYIAIAEIKDSLQSIGTLNMTKLD